MSKVFSKSRIKNINNLNIKKYLMYAVGEILIVTIGIFLAIYLNNLKETSTNRKYINEVIEEVKKEAEKYIANSNYFISYNAKRDTLMAKILKGNFTINDYELNGIKHINIIQQQANLIFSKIPLDNLNRRIDYLNDNEKEIYEELVKINKKQEINSFISTNTLEILKDYKKYQKENNDWFSLTEFDSIAIKKEYNFRRTSYRYKNFIKDFREYEVVAKSINFDYFRTVSFNLLCKVIEVQKKGEMSPFEIDSTLNKLRYNKLDKLKCDTILKKTNNEYHLFNDIKFYSILYNSSNDTITIKAEKNTLEILPKTFSFRKLHIGVPIKVSINNECQAQYMSKINGYLFYE